MDPQPATGGGWDNLGNEEGFPDDLLDNELWMNFSCKEENLVTAMHSSNFDAAKLFRPIHPTSESPWTDFGTHILVTSMRTFLTMLKSSMGRNGEGLDSKLHSTNLACLLIQATILKQALKSPLTTTSIPMARLWISRRTRLAIRPIVRLEATTSLVLRRRRAPCSRSTFVRLQTRPQNATYSFRRRNCLNCSEPRISRGWLGRSMPSLRAILSTSSTSLSPMTRRNRLSARC